MSIPLFTIGKDRSITVGSSSTLALSEDRTRVFARFTNDSDEVIYLMLGENAVMNQGIRLAAAGGAWEINSDNRYTGSVYAICTSGSKKLLILTNTSEKSSSSSSSSNSSSSSSFSSSSSSLSSSSCSSSFSSSSFSSSSYSSSSFSSCSSSFSSSSFSSGSFSSSSSSFSSSSFSSCSSSFSSSSFSSCSSSCSSSFSSSCSSSYSSSSSSGSCATGTLTMLDTGLKSPHDEGTLWNNWYQAENAYADNSSYAVSTKDDTQDYETLAFGTLENVIRITGIEVSVKGYRVQAGDTTMSVQLSWNNGTDKTTAQDVTISGGSVEETNTVGSNWNDWDHTWTVDELSNNTFWLGFTTGGDAGDDVRINHVQVKVYYQVCS